MNVSKKKEARNKSEIVGATIELLDKINYSSLTIEVVAERSGVAKTTIYRWWNHKSDLVFDAFIAKTETLFEYDLTKSIHENFVQQLLTLTSILNSSVGRALLMVISERKEAAAEFVHAYLAQGFLANFETVYHINGQHVVSINGDKAEGTLYCRVDLISNENGKKINNTLAVSYKDGYVYENGKWLIAKRTSNFVWNDRKELNQ